MADGSRRSDGSKPVGSRQSAVGRRPERIRRTVLCLLPAVCCLLVLTGCVRRSLTIRTDPPGALVYVNDELKGKSPVTYDFVWYGWRRVMVRKEGFERVEDRKFLRSPVYLWIPLDLVMELLPFPIRDERAWQYTLSPAAVPAVPTPPQTFIVPPASVQPPARSQPAPKPVEPPEEPNPESSDAPR